MKKATSIGMFAAIAFAVGMTGINLSDGTIVLQNSPSATADGASILGHIELIHTDKEGNILSYQQTDNAIVSQGRACTAMLLFGENTECPAATKTDIGNYTTIGIGNGSLLAADTTAQALNSEITGDGLARALGTLGTYTATSGTGTDATQRITKQFTYTGSQSGNVISQAGLFNSTTISSDSTFALKNFPSNVTMNNGDQLTVNWDITVSGSDAVS